MSRHVKISTLCAPLHPVGAGASPEAAVVEMIRFWREQVELVLPDQPDLIVLPELCDRPLDLPEEQMDAYYAARGNRVQDALAELARAHHCYLTYSALIEKPDGFRRNAVVLLDRRGEIAGEYHKNHVMVEERTQHNTLYGRDIALFDCDFGRMGCVICFDLNFDELRLRYKAAKPDLLIFSSIFNGGLMQPYWAFSCRAHLVSAIGGGTLGSIISPLGQTLTQTTNYFPFTTATVNLDCAVAHLDYNWDKLRAMKAKYGVGVKVTDPGCLGSVLVSAESPELTIDGLIAEFGLELLDDYLARADAHRHAPGSMEEAATLG